MSRIIRPPAAEAKQHDTREGETGVRIPISRMGGWPPGDGRLAAACLSVGRAGRCGVRKEDRTVVDITGSTEDVEIAYPVVSLVDTLFSCLPVDLPPDPRVSGVENESVSSIHIYRSLFSFRGSSFRVRGLGVRRASG
ncbi:hypothetical protein MRX96_029440 [Rhipicephalus microplus]